MSDQTLVNTYKRYKAGTQKLVRWLVESAGGNSTAVSKSARVNRLPKKVRTVDLVPFAEQIVAYRDPIVVISLVILDITKDVNTGRTSCVDFYSSLVQGKHDPSGVKDSNADHQHFLGTLIQVFDILRNQHKARGPKRKKNMPERATDTNDLANLFQHLQLQDTAEVTATGESSTKRSGEEARSIVSKENTDDIELDNRDEESCSPSGRS